MVTLDVSLPAMETSHDYDEGGKPKHVIYHSTTDTSTKSVRAQTKTALDVSLSASDESHKNDAGHFIPESTTDTPTTLDLSNIKATFDISLVAFEASYDDVQ